MYLSCLCLAYMHLCINTTYMYVLLAIVGQCEWVMPPPPCQTCIEHCTAPPDRQVCLFFRGGGRVGVEELVWICNGYTNTN